MQDHLLGCASEECLPIEMGMCNKKKYTYFQTFGSWDKKGTP